VRNHVKLLAGICCGPCNPSKWEADIWGWLEVRRSAILHYTVKQHPHWACRQYGHSGGTRGWLGVERWQLCHRPAAVGHWVSLCVCSVLGWLIVCQLGILSLSCSQYSQTICWRGWDDNACLGVRNTSSIGALPNSLDRRPLWYCIVSPLLQTNKHVKLGVSPKVLYCVADTGCGLGKSLRDFRPALPKSQNYQVVKT
jgi:hypothetical protein